MTEEDLAPAWMAEAACAGEFATMMPRGLEGGGTTKQTMAQVARAKTICDSCPVQEPCLEYALTAGPGGGPPRDGIWSGLPPAKLEAIARERRQVA